MHTERQGPGRGTGNGWLRNAGVVTITCAALAGCGASHQTKGAIIGAGAGGVVGGVIGHELGSTAAGAIVGAAVGGATGALIGHHMDVQAQELSQEIAGATVTRVGEGIAVTFASGLLFDFNSAAVRPEAAQNLRALAANLQRHTDTDLLIVGHTDATGTDAYNMELSQRRAQAMADYLGTQGVARSRLNVSGRGEMEPIAPNDTEEGRQQNRRVEVAIYASAAARSGTH